MTATRSILVVGYGNTLRRDDGVGPIVADTISELSLPGVRTLSCALLTPELADPISQVERVVFVDAAVDAPQDVQLRPLKPAESSQIIAHAANPATMLALARDVFGHAPEGWLLTIPAKEMGIGEDLSSSAQKGVETALAEIRKLVAGRVESKHQAPNTRLQISPKPQA